MIHGQIIIMTHYTDSPFVAQLVLVKPGSGNTHVSLTVCVSLCLFASLSLSLSLSLDH